MEFDPCGHILENDYDADGLYHSDTWAHEQMVKIRKIQEKTFKWSQTHRTFPHERNLMDGVQCPWCDEKTIGISIWIDNKHSEMPERQFKAFRIMGWV